MSRPPSMRASASATTRSWTRTAIRWTAIWCTWRATRPSAAAAQPLYLQVQRAARARRGGRTGPALLRHCYTEFTYLSRFLPSIYYGEHGNGEKPAALVGVKAWDPAAGVCYAASFLPSSPPAMRGNPTPGRRHRPARVLLPVLRPAGRQHPFPALGFAERGLDSAFIGLIVATALLPKILSTPAVAHVADQTGRAHALIAAALIGSLLLYACYPLAATPVWLFAVTLLLNAVFPRCCRCWTAWRSPAGAARAIPTPSSAPGSLGFALMTVRRLSHQDPRRELGDVAAHADDRGCLAMLRLLPRAARPRRTPRPRRRASRPCAPCCATARCCCASPPPRWCRPATASCIPIRRCTGRPRACPPR